LDAPRLFAPPDSGPFGRRQARPRGARIPVIVVTGFLGAGKTTLIRHFLGTPEGRGTAVVVNEFGEAGIDDALLRESTDAVSLLGNGCVCCAVRSDLQLTLRALIADRARGAIPDFTRVVIETSGLADPGPILQSFATDRALGDSFYIEAVITVADAATGIATLEAAAEARKQVILADRMVVTKTDIADPPRTTALIGRIKRLNPRAAIATTINGHIDSRVLLKPASTDRNPFVAEAEHSDGIGSFVLRAGGPLPWPTFARAMDTLTALRGPDLLRVKGLLNVEGCQGPVLVEFVQHLAHPPVELRQWPEGSREGRLVFITRNISEAQVRGLFAAVSALG
jgi:G3E family GTPase